MSHRLQDAHFRFPSLILVQESSAMACAGSHVGICGFNSIEWAICDLACALTGMVSVGIHSTLTTDEAAHVIVHTDLTGLLVSEAFLICKSFRAR